MLLTSLLPRRYVTEWTRDIVEDFVAKIPEAGCWLWMGALSAEGKPYIYINGAVVPATRVIYPLFRNSFDRKTILCHTCDIKCCVNPWHLYEGTKSSNTIDAIVRGQQKTKLSISQVIEIRTRYRAGSNKTLLARDFGVSVRLIFDIVNNIKWKFV